MRQLVPMQAESVEPAAIIESDVLPIANDSDFVLEKRGRGVFQRNVSRYMKQYHVDKEFATERIRKLMEQVEGYDY